MASITEIRQQFPQYSDLPDAELASAIHRKFYSDMPAEQFNSKIGLVQQQPAKPEPTLWDETKAVASKALTGIGYAATAPEGAANLLKEGINWGVGKVVPGYTEAVQKADALRNQVKSIPTPNEAVQTLGQNLPQPQTPIGKVAGAVTEAIPSALALTPNALNSVPNAISAATRFGAVPAATSELAGQAFEGTDIETPVRIGTSLVTGAVAGMLPGGVKAPTTVPTKNELTQQAKAAYDKVDQAGVVVHPQAYNTKMNQMFTNLANEGFDPTLHPKAAAALNRMDELRGMPVSFQTLETMRKIAKTAAGSIERDERRIGYLMLNQIDDLVDNLTPQNTVAGNAANVAQDIKEARTLWSQVRKSDTLDELMLRAENRAAQFSGSGLENAIRTEFRQLVQNPKKLRGFTVEEQAALRKVAQGGPIENVLRWMGKLSPSGAVSGAISGGAGYALGGPIGAMALPAAGYMARQGATKMTNRNAQIANELMRGGSGRSPSNPSAAILYRALMEGQ